MSTVKEILTLGLFICGGFLRTGVACAQTPDRILTLDSEVKVYKDRTLHVEEILEISNRFGAFDAGIHRRLTIKRVSPQRSKAGSFLALGAKIDGHNAVLRTTDDGKTLDIEIAPGTGVLSRGNHSIELSYTAKHQFAIYDDFEDLNQDISGEWPVPIEKATVALIIPEGLPKQTGISADTGTNSKFQFDCVRTDLPSGVRFETTHSLSPGERLFISARFPHPGYFVSDFKEDGYRAVLQNHPLLIPRFALVCSSILFAAIGFFVWRRAPEGGSITAAALSNEALSANFWRAVWSVYGFPIIMFALAIIPALNFTYSGHGGISWFFVPLCFPWVIARMLVKVARGSQTSRAWYKGFFKITVPSYVALALPLSWAAATSIRATFGLPISTWNFFLLMISPFPWWYFT